LDEQEEVQLQRYFSSLDEGASRSEEWVSRNQNYILGVIGVMPVAVLGYMAILQFVGKAMEKVVPNECYILKQFLIKLFQGNCRKGFIVLL